MHIKQPNFARQPSIRTYPLQKSSSAVLIFGDRADRSYPDSLINFHKDFATLEAQRRSKQVQRKKLSLQKKKQENLTREFLARQNSDSSRQKLLEKQQRSQQLYREGLLKSTLENSLPINPLSFEYKKNERGQKLAADEEVGCLKRVARAHFLHTIGNSGYNIINCGSTLDFDKMVPVGKQQAFEQRITRLYSMFKLNPEGTEQPE